MSFIWAETSFFSAWWNILQSEDGKEAIKTLLDNGQLEIVTGGWVMNDEATTHYSAMIAQMVDGHEFLKHNLNYTPRYGWAIDPFGASPTMAFLLKKMGFKGMVIQRVHYSIKKYLAQHKMLEFNWRQFWESSQNTGSDIMCHIEPFYSYDVSYHCLIFAKQRSFIASFSIRFPIHVVLILKFVVNLILNDCHTLELVVLGKCLHKKLVR